MSKTTLRLVSPTKEIRPVMPRRRPNSELRPREHLTEREVEKLIAAAKDNRHGHRDATMILVTLPARPAGQRTLRTAVGGSGRMSSSRPRPFTSAGPRVEQ
jgi:hypothetical protein